MKNIIRIYLGLMGLYLLSTGQLLANTANTFTIGNSAAVLYGVHEVQIEGTELNDINFTFTNTTYNIHYKVHGFYDGVTSIKARLYCSKEGHWTWDANDHGNLVGSGAFDVVVPENIQLRGKLKASGKFLLWENNESFIPIMDTAYHLLSADSNDGEDQYTSETDFQQFVHDSQLYGANIIRSGIAGITYFDESLQEVVDRLARLFVYDNGHLYFNYNNYNSDDRRIQWMLANYPNIQMQLILYGAGDGYNTDDQTLYSFGELQRKKLLQYIIDRYAAYPNIMFLIYNDLPYTPDGTGSYEYNKMIADEAGEYLKIYDPFDTLRATGHKRGYSYTVDFSDWTTYVHLQTSVDLDAKTLDQHRNRAIWENIPIICGEDRYENADSPGNVYGTEFDAEYFYRRGSWAWVLSGGGFAYGAKWWNITPYSQLQTYGHTGMESIRYIHKFFNDFELIFQNFMHDDSIASNGYTNIDKVQAMQDEDTFVMYTPIKTDITLQSPDLNNNYKYRWMNPSTGVYTPMENVYGSEIALFTFPAEFNDDGVLIVSKKESFTGVPLPTPSPSPSPSPLPSPSPIPVNPNITEVTSDSAVLKWVDNFDNELGFKIYKDNILIATLEANSTSYKLAGLEENRSYTYTIKMYNDVEETVVAIVVFKTQGKFDWLIPVLHILQ